MPGFDGMGGFTFPYNWVNDAANGIDITASRMDTQFATATGGFDLCLTRDGQGAASANLPMNGFKFTGLGVGSNPNDSVTYAQLTNSAAALTGFLGGLTLSTAGSSGTFGIASGVAVDSTSALFMSLPSAFTKTTGAFSAGTGNGALDASTIANSTWYHVFLIGSPGVTSDILISLSPTAPTLPGGFTLFRRIGSMKTDGSAHWIAFIQNRDTFSWNVAIFDKSNATPAASWEYVTLTVPTGAKVRPIFGIFGNSTDSSTHYLSLNNGNSTPSGNVVIIQNTRADNNPSDGTSVDAYYTNTSAQIHFLGASASMQYSIFTNGWIDDRGQG